MKVEWSAEALDQAAKYLDDRAGLADVFEATDALANDPEPVTSFAWGPLFRRLRVGRYRVLYTFGDDLIVIQHVDRAR